MRYVQKIWHHRGGRYHVVLFREDRTMMVATVFEVPGCVAIIKRKPLEKGIVENGYTSYPGDEQWLRDTIATYGDNWPKDKTKPA